MWLTLNTRAAIGVTAIALAVASCGSRGQLAFMPEAASVGSVETVLVSTNRAPVEGLPLYTRGRVSKPQFSRFQISVPPDRKLGTVTFPSVSRPNPRTDFLVVAAQRLPDERAFIAGINAMLAAEPTARRSATIFIHGYNTNFAEGLYRQAQLQHDSGAARRLDPFRLALGGQPAGLSLRPRKRALLPRRARDHD